MSRVWVVRAGAGGVESDAAYRADFVGIGWSEITDAPAITDENELRRVIAETYPDEPASRRAQWFGQLRAFLFTINVGDLVLLPSAGGEVLHVGEVASGPQAPPTPTASLNIVRRVQWIGDIHRDKLTADLRNASQSIMTVFEVKRGSDATRVRALAAGDPDPGAGTKSVSQVGGDPSAASRRSSELSFALATVYAAEAHPIQLAEAMDKARKICEPLPDERTLNKSGNERFTHTMRWQNLGLSKVKWIAPGNGRGEWQITDAGRGALATHPDCHTFGRELSKQYKAEASREKEGDQRNRREEGLRRLLRRIPAGRWATFTDVEHAVNWHRSQIGPYLWDNHLPGWHRVLRSDGTISADQYDAQERAGLPHELLAADGLQFATRAPVAA